MTPNAQAAQVFKCVEVAVTVQQQVIVLNAESSHQHINRTANGEALGPQAAVVLRCIQDQITASDHLDGQRLQQALGLAVVMLVTETPQHFKKYQVWNHQSDFALVEQMFKMLS